MSKGTPQGSFFASSQAIVNGGFFTITNTQIHNAEKTGYARLLEAVAPNALHDSGHIVDPPKCHPGTRIAIIQAIMDWIAGSNKDTCDKLITWLTGAAGAGKSAIGRTVCERCAEEGTLLASFFFGSNDPTRNHSRSLVATIAYQLCSISPAFRDTVSSFVDYDPFIFNRSLQTQFSSLVIGPLSKSLEKEPRQPPVVIVVDGLDECLDKGSQRDILQALLYVVTNSPICILVCSCPESQITTSFNATNKNNTLFKIFLGDEYLPHNDIELYLRDHFREVRACHILKSSLSPSWPGDNHISKLVEKSSGQFIYASTVILYIASPRHRPDQRLDAILGLCPPFKDLPFSELDALYTHILSSTDDLHLTADIVALLALYGEMRLEDIDALLGIDAGEAEVALSGLGAVVGVREDGNGALCAEAFLLHKSIEDFLFDSHRSKTLFKNRAETRVRHILRVIELASVGQFLSVPVLDVLHIRDIPFETWNNSSQLVFVKGLTKFPMESYCRGCLSGPRIDSPEIDFLLDFFKFLVILSREEAEPVKCIYDKHARVFCDYVLSELHDTYSTHWEMNLIFTATQLASGSTMALRNFRFISLVGLGNVLPRLKFPLIFQQTLNTDQASLIISKAAIHCLEFICDVLRTKNEAIPHLRIGRRGRKKRYAFPWRWHRRTSNREIGEKNLLVAAYRRGRIRLILSKYRALPRRTIRERSDQLYPVNSFEWTRWISKWPTGTQMWYQYMTFLEYIPVLLPRAAEYSLLVRLCETRCFAPMSMMFPDESLRARRAIAEFLNRTECDLDMEMEIDE